MSDEPENAPIGEDPNIGSLEERIVAARKAEAARLEREHGKSSEVRSSAMQIASTMVGYPLGGIIIGLLLDNLFDTLPWITIVLMFLAFIGACIHVVRMNKSGTE